MVDFVIVHGSYGSPDENWFMWLSQALEKAGKKVLVPQFPCGEAQNYQNWCAVLNTYKHLFNTETSFVGHSLAPAFIVDYLLDNNLLVKNLYFVAPFYDAINIPDFDKVNTPFFIQTDLEKIAQLSQKRICFVSQNDPYVPNELSVDFATRTSSEIVRVPNAGHFNAAAGYVIFPRLLEEIEKDLG